MVDDDLRDEYRNAEAAFTEVSIIVPGGDSFHRAGCDGTTPACSADSSEWRAVATDDASRLGMAPCRNCYAAVLNYLAGVVDDSPVEHREEAATADTPDTPEGDLVIADGGAAVAKPPQLTSRPEEVLVTTNGSTTYHAPASGGAPLCGTAGSFRRVERVVLAGQKDACTECFDTDAIDTSTP